MLKNIELSTICCYINVIFAGYPVIYIGLFTISTGFSTDCRLLNRVFCITMSKFTEKIETFQTIKQSVNKSNKNKELKKILIKENAYLQLMVSFHSSSSKLTTAPEIYGTYFFGPWKHLI